MKIQDLLIRRKNSNKIVAVFGNQQITYKELYEKAFIISSMIKKIQSEYSKCIALFLPNSINYLISYFAILLADGVVAPIGTNTRQAEVVSMLEYCETEIILTDIENLGILKNMLSDTSANIKIICADDIKVTYLNKDSEVYFHNKKIAPDLAGGDVALLLHTSGTLSSPKRVMLTHYNLIQNVESNIESLKLTEKDKVLISLPMHFGYCNTAQMLTHIYLGAMIVIMKSPFFAKDFYKTVQNYKITNYTAVPSLLKMILQYRYFDNYDVSSLRYICFGGGKINKETILNIIERFTEAGVIQTYGQTEASPRVTALLPEYSIKKCGSVGKGIKNVTVKIINENGTKCQPFDKGEICVKGPNVMKGYFKQPEITKKTVIDGWLHTGDIGYFDEEGFLYIIGRIKNMIITNGINIYPEMIEEVIALYPGIKEVKVLGRDDYMKGEVPIAHIVCENSTLDTVDLKAYCRSKLEEYKIPVEFIMTDELPKTYNGKIKRGC